MTNYIFDINEIKGFADIAYIITGSIRDDDSRKEFDDADFPFGLDIEETLENMFNTYSFLDGFKMDGKIYKKNGIKSLTKALSNKGITSPVSVNKNHKELTKLLDKMLNA